MLLYGNWQQPVCCQKDRGRLLSIPHLMRQEMIRIEDEAVGIVCPVYNVEFPMMVREFIAERTFIPTISSWCLRMGKESGRPLHM